MNILLLGGSGFIGSLLGRKLVGQNHTVTSVSLDGLGDAPGVTSLPLDLYQSALPEDVLNRANIVVILVGQVYPGFDAQKEEQLISHIAKQLSKVQAKVIFFSTVLVYGEAVHPAHESTPLKPIDRYGQFKVQAETILQDIIPSNRLLIFRLANIYGGIKNKGVIGTVFNSLIKPNSTITINGDGSQERDYLLIDNLIEIASQLITDTAITGCINVATGKSYSLLQLVAILKKVTHKPIPYILKPFENEEITISRIDNTKLRNLIPSISLTSLEEGLHQTYTRYQEQNI